MRTTLFFALGLLLLAPSDALAARFFFEGDNVVGVGEVVPLSLMLDMEGADANALEGTVLVTGGIRITGVQERDSVVTLWIERPSVEGGRTSSFAGVIPGGFTGLLSPFWEGGQPGVVYTLLIEGAETGSARISLGPGAQVLANDGQGSRIPVTATDFSLVVREAGEPPAEPLPKDTVGPTMLEPLIGTDPSIGGGSHFIAFAAHDDESGIDHYEIAETRTGFSAPQYAVAESPHVLSDQTLRSYIHIKAVDRAGNETVIIVPPAHTPWVSYLGTILIAALLLVFLRVILRYRHAFLP
jgi:hypothetical protein